MSLQSYHIILEKDRNLEAAILTTTSNNLQKAKSEWLSKELIRCTLIPTSEGGSKDKDIADKQKDYLYGIIQIVFTEPTGIELSVEPCVNPF